MSTPEKAIVMTIEGMHCENCAGKIRAALSRVRGVSSVEVDLSQKRASVRFDSAATTAGSLMQAVNAAGFKATGFAAGRA